MFLCLLYYDSIGNEPGFFFSYSFAVMYWSPNALSYCERLSFAHLIQLNLDSSGLGEECALGP